MHWWSSGTMDRRCETGRLPTGRSHCRGKTTRHQHDFAATLNAVRERPAHENDIVGGVNIEGSDLLRYSAEETQPFYTRAVWTTRFEQLDHRAVSESL
jgi:hypothetical protein